MEFDGDFEGEGVNCGVAYSPISASLLKMKRLANSQRRISHKRRQDDVLSGARLTHMLLDDSVVVAAPLQELLGARDLLALSSVSHEFVRSQLRASVFERMIIHWPRKYASCTKLKTALEQFSGEVVHHVVFPGYSDMPYLKRCLTNLRTLKIKTFDLDVSAFLELRTLVIEFLVYLTPSAINCRPNWRVCRWSPRQDGRLDT